MNDIVRTFEELIAGLVLAKSYTNALKKFPLKDTIALLEIFSDKFNEHFPSDHESHKWLSETMKIIEDISKIQDCTLATSYRQLENGNYRIKILIGERWLEINKEFSKEELRLK